MTGPAKCIAIIDDDPSVLRALRRTLRVRSFECRTYASAEEFLGSIAGGLPDCLILDLQMPEMTGLELHKHLTGTGVDIPTILITAHADARLQERCRALGIMAMLTKPLRNVALFELIDAATRPAERSPAE